MITARIKLENMSNKIEKDICIIGAGPVGLFAIFECGMMKMDTVVVDALDFVGGQCTALYPEKPIYDIAGFPSVDAGDLITNLEKQAEPFKPEYVLGEQVCKVQGEAGNWQLETNKGTKIECKAIIIAAGCGAFGPNRPPLENVESYEANGGVNYMVRKRADFADKDVVIAGGGDSALDWAISLSEVAKSVSLVHRRPKFRAAPDSVEKMHKLVEQGKIDLVVPYQLHSLQGENGNLEAVNVATLDDEVKALKADNLLAFFGLSMELGPIADWGLNLHMKHIETTQSNAQTSTEGIYAIGDIATYEGKLKLIVCGFSEAAMAAHSAYKHVFPDTEYHFEYSTSKGVAA